ncbi:hypothetical protein [Paramagnetospirillum magnetotacticum]|uniref:hypothetical protein n=1 Tax=Paramagnetospirillum magnetotacticum TaxID=188 RepID=UPI0000383C4B|nr:hypothetical protein [Paramagnetospirillum magnetotacticum]
MATDWSALERRLERAAGSDPELDRDLAAAFGVVLAPFTSSVSDCHSLAEAALPGIRLHLGYGASGVFPYASLRGQGLSIISDAATVPLAILRSLVAAKAGPGRQAPPEA